MNVAVDFRNVDIVFGADPAGFAGADRQGRDPLGDP